MATKSEADSSLQSRLDSLLVTFTSEVGQIRNESMEQYIEASQQKEFFVDLFQKEIQEDLEEIKTKVLAVRANIESKIFQKGNEDGFLVGQVDDYIQVFDGQVAILNKQLDVSKQHWTDEIKKAEEETKAEKLRKIIAAFKRKIESEIFISAVPSVSEIESETATSPANFVCCSGGSRYMMKDLPVFGDPSKGVRDFRWPTPELLEKRSNVSTL